jgi:hypothetical protein
MKEDGKFIVLFGTIFFSFLGFIGFIIAIMFGLKFFFGMLDKMPWFALLFTFFIVCVPALIFLTVFAIYFVRTKSHPSLPVRIFSYIVFVIAISAWIFFWAKDILLFFKKYFNSINYYDCYNLAFLSANVGVIFLVGIVQALSTKKELGWMEKNEAREKANLLEE